MKTSLSPAWRDLLHAWPEGEERQHEWRTLKWKHTGAVVSTHSVTQAIDRGLVTLIEETPGQFSRTIRVLKRTARPIKPYTPRGPDPNYKGPYPWGIDEHWRRIEKSPARAVRGITAELAETEPEDPEYWELRFRHPRIVSSRTELSYIREALLHFFTEGKRSSRRMNWGWVPQPLKYVLNTGEGIQLLFLEMLIRPVFVAGRFKQFEAINGKEAEREITRLVGNTGNLREKYQQYVERETVEVA